MPASKRNEAILRTGRAVARRKPPAVRRKDSVDPIRCPVEIGERHRAASSIQSGVIDGRNMMRMTIIALSLIVVTAPASAADPSPNQAATVPQGANAAKPQERKYCIQLDDIVGSRIRGKMECKTKADWAREGIDVSRPSEN
jgi:hypothetical protein